MSARRESKGNAFLIPVEQYTTGKGESRIRGYVGGDPEAAEELVAHLKATADAHEVTPEEAAKSRMFSGFGSGKMDASRGSRTKLVFKRGTGWVSNN